MRMHVCVLLQTDPPCLNKLAAVHAVMHSNQRVVTFRLISVLADSGASCLPLERIRNTETVEPTTSDEPHALTG